MQGQLLGTPAYMAPEQALARHDLVDQRTDIYGLGAILYEILTGRPPFVAPKTSEIIRKVCNEAPPPPRQIVPEIAPGLEAVCLKALRKEKADRYQHASDLAQEVRRYLADEPVRAYAEPWTLRAWRWVRRNRVKVTAAAVSVLIAAIALGVSTYVVTGERNEAEAQGQQARRAVHLLTNGIDIASDEQLDAVQREKLQDALAYYERFTSRAAKDPAVRVEQGRDYQRMGDFERKLGRFQDSEAAYRKAIATLEPLTGDARVGRDARRNLARTRTLLGDLLVRHGTDRGRAEPLYAEALKVQQVLADAKQDPAATAEDILRMGQTDKSRGDLLRLDGKRAEAAPAYDRAIAEFERAQAADAKLTEARNDLALAIDARGWVRRELGRLEDAEKDFRRAIDMLEKLVAEFPTVPRHREALARALNSLGLIERDTGRLADAETHFGQELPLVDRLRQDFPDRAEYHRVLARTLSNLGITLSDQHRNDDAEPILVRAVKVNTEVSARSPEDVQIRFDLAKDQICLGVVQGEKGDTASALISLQAARAITDKLAQDFPDRPRYRELLAQNLVDLAAVMQETDPAKADELYQTAGTLFDKLVAAHPDVVDYRVGQAQCLRDQGHALAVVDRNEQAEAVYQRGLAVLEVKDGRSQRPDWLRMRADLLTNLGDSLVFRGKHAGDIGRSKALYDAAAPHIRRAMAIFESLASAKNAALDDRYRLAVIQYNLGECLFFGERAKEAEPFLNQAEAGFERALVAAPKSIDYHRGLGEVEGLKGKLLVRDGKLAEAATVLAKAVEQQERAVQLSNSLGSMRKLLAEHLVELAKLDVDRGVYEQAAGNALRATRVVPNSSRGEICLKAAKALARLVKQVDGNSKLGPADRERLTRPYAGRTIVLVRDAIDSDPKLAARIKDDPDIKVLESRPEFKTLMNSLVDLRQ
jgi:tetratricopeptide (TPR) repeat protein